MWYFTIVHQWFSSARHIIAVEPLLYRRTVAASGAFGATAATAPGKAALEAVRAVAPRGADVVLEMVGHNQEMGMGMGKWGIGEVEILLRILRLPEVSNGILGIEEMGSGNMFLGNLDGIVTKRYVDMWEGMRMGRDQIYNFI